VNVGALVAAQKKIQDLLDEKETILKEVHHRVKNNMNTIAGMLWLQADTMKDKTAAQALLDAQGRIMNMMVLYNKLFRSSQFATLSAKEFIEDMILHIRSTQDPAERIQVALSIQDAQIDSKKLQTIGMIVNELMTNVYKYAFPLGAEGHASVSMSYPEEGIMLLEVRDSGRGLPESILTHSDDDGFGMMLIRMLTEQLEATYEIRNENGARFSFRIPI
jgi:two-component sensor histidine kinase